MFLCVNIAKFEQTGMLCERGRKYSNGHMRVSYRQRDRLRERDKLMHPRIHDSCNVCKCECNIQSQSDYTQALEETDQKKEPANWRRRLKDGDKEGDKERFRVIPSDRSREGEREVRERDRKERETTREKHLSCTPRQAKLRTDGKKTAGLTNSLSIPNLRFDVAPLHEDLPLPRVPPLPSDGLWSQRVP